MTVLELINKAREDNDFDVIGAINVKEYLPVNEKREVIDLVIARCSEYEEGNVLLNGVELYIIFHICTKVNIQYWSILVIYSIGVF